MGVLVAQLVQGKIQAGGDLQRGVEQPGRVDAPQFGQAPQMALAIGMQAGRTGAQRQPATDRRQGVLHGTAAARVHVHVARRHRRNAVGVSKRQQPCAASRLVAIRVQLHGKPDPPGKMRLEPAGIARLRLAFPGLRGQPQHQATGWQLLEVRAHQVIGALVRRPSSAGDQAAESRVAFPVGSEHDEPQAVRHAELAANEQLQGMAARRHMGTDDARHRTLIGQREGGVPQCCRPLHQLGRVGRAPQEREVADAMELGVATHPNTPCRYQPWLRRSWYTQSTAPRGLLAR